PSSVVKGNSQFLPLEMPCSRNSVLGDPSAVTVKFQESPTKSPVELNASSAMPEEPNAPVTLSSDTSKTNAVPRQPLRFPNAFMCDSCCFVSTAQPLDRFYSFRR